MKMQDGLWNIIRDSLNCT